PTMMQAQILEVNGICLDYQACTVSTSNFPAIALTAKELNLLEYFLSHPNQVLTHDQIRSRLWSLADESVSNVVAAQIRLLRRKLAECGRPDCIETLRGLGYRFRTHYES
ncbi:MAG: winged helix-turn-helix domain-containing protein, partial [Synechococcales bacterium]|nr:winged helix-turn-helix domain-containing protein [Synechococcales bacterium]